MYGDSEISADKSDTVKLPISALLKHFENNFYQPVANCR